MIFFHKIHARNLKKHILEINLRTYGFPSSFIAVDTFIVQTNGVFPQTPTFSCTFVSSYLLLNAFSKIFSNHPSKQKQVVMSTDRWYHGAWSQFCPADAKRDLSLFQVTTQVRGALTLPDPTTTSCGQTCCLHGRIAANGYSQGMGLLFAFSRCHEHPMFWILMKPFAASFAALKYSASDILFCSHFSQVLFLLTSFVVVK